jgi:endonuclease III related protein
MRRRNLLDDARKNQIRGYYRALFQAWGPQNWWPARSRFEVIVGAYLTQNTAWTNVEKALANLRSVRLLSVKGVRHVPLGELERLIRPSGYFRQKAKRLKTFINVSRSSGMEALCNDCFRGLQQRASRRTPQLNGVGPETADSICFMPAIIRYSWWTHTRGAFWCGMGFCRQRRL